MSEILWWRLYLYLTQGTDKPSYSNGLGCCAVSTPEAERTAAKAAVKDGAVTDSDDAIEGLESLLGILRERVDLRTEFRRFLDKKPVFAVAEFKDVGTADATAGVSVPHLKMSDGFRVFIAALRASKRDAHVLGGSFNDGV
jgi:hypothetical protein